MSIPRWTPATKTTRQEELLLKRLTTKRKLFGFLRQHRAALFDEAFQAELEAMYRDTGAGKEPVAPALFAMAVLLRGYDGVSDAEAVERTVIDLRWQLVLDRLGATEPAFSQSALHDFRHRLIRHEMDRRLLERTVELAKATKEFDWKKLPKTLRIAVDSAPLEGSGRVEGGVRQGSPSSQRQPVAMPLGRAPVTRRSPHLAAQFTRQGAPRVHVRTDTRASGGGSVRDLCPKPVGSSGVEARAPRPREGRRLRGQAEMPEDRDDRIAVRDVGEDPAPPAAGTGEHVVQVESAEQ